MSNAEDVAHRQRVLTRRIALGTATIIAFLWALWDVWDVPTSVFVEAIVGIGFMIFAAMAFGAILGALLAHWRRRNDR